MVVWLPEGTERQGGTRYPAGSELSLAPEVPLGRRKHLGEVDGDAYASGSQRTNVVVVLPGTSHGTARSGPSTQVGVGVVVSGGISHGTARSGPSTQAVVGVVVGVGVVVSDGMSHGTARSGPSTQPGTMIVGGDPGEVNLLGGGVRGLPQ